MRSPSPPFRKPGSWYMKVTKRSSVCSSFCSHCLRNGYLLHLEWKESSNLSRMAWVYGLRVPAQTVATHSTQSSHTANFALSISAVHKVLRPTERFREVRSSATAKLDFWKKRGQTLDTPKLPVEPPNVSKSTHTERTGDSARLVENSQSLEVYMVLRYKVKETFLATVFSGTGTSVTQFRPELPGPRFEIPSEKSQLPKAFLGNQHFPLPKRSPN